MTHRYACLLGNGFALQYEPSLSVYQLTADLQNKFQTLGGPPGSLKGIPQFASRPGDSFEEMLGPIEAAGDVARELRRLSRLSSDHLLRLKINDTANFAALVHRVGMATVLDLIAARSAGVGAVALQPLVDFAAALTTLVVGRADDLVLGTLNYDGLTHAALLDAQPGLCDLAVGWGRGSKQPVPGVSSFAHQLRTEDNFVAGQTLLLQLHGSLGWLRSANGNVWKFSIDDLRINGYWRSLERGTTSWEPVVVLTDRKERTIESDPFRFAYSVFEDRLRASDRWLIAGYGRGDTPVNELLRRAWSARRRSGTAAGTRVLVVEHSGCGLTKTQGRSDLAQKTGIARAQIAVTKAGISGAPGTTEWSAWSDDR